MSFLYTGPQRFYLKKQTVKNNNMDFNNFVSYNDEPPFTRNFEQLITERGNLEIFTQDTENGIFNIIKNKLYIIDDDTIPPLTQQQETEYSKKYDTDNLFGCISKFKKEISNLYNKKIQMELNIEEKKKKYSSCCKNIDEFLKCTGISDKILHDALIVKIEEYYIELNLEKLINKYNKICSEFTFLKKALLELNDVSNPSVCNICLERQVEWFIDPCGHTLCGDCKDICEKNNFCHYCRQKKNIHRRLYL